MGFLIHQLAKLTVIPTWPLSLAQYGAFDVS